MLSYRHSFHAGNHADILKHFALSLITKSLCKKEKPFIFYDVHAGRGLYSLVCDEAEKTGEAQNGIIKLFSLIDEDQKIPTDFREFLLFEKKLFDTKKEYAGSFIVVDHFSRDYDKIVTFELHSTEINELRTTIKNLHTDKISAHNRNGYEGINALIPPKDPLPKRGFILLDPSYEVNSDYTAIEKTVSSVLKKWSNATVVVWYPLLEHRVQEIHQLKNMDGLHNTEHFFIELKIGNPKDLQNRLYGSGLIIINPPYQLEEKIREVIPILEKNLSI
ncbi:MAG: 23S rRNA (adenine(2030)-N(6))-methyltransferase RlmJ [Treponemataceae bacterium]